MKKEVLEEVYRIVYHAVKERLKDPSISFKDEEEVFNMIYDEMSISEVPVFESAIWDAIYDYL